MFLNNCWMQMKPDYLCYKLQIGNRYYVTREIAKAPGIKPYKDSSTVLFCANVNGKLVQWSTNLKIQEIKEE